VTALDAKLLAFLSQISPEEQSILSGKLLDKDTYASGNTFVIDSEKMLAGRLLQVRTHTRFVEFPDHSHNYVEMVYMCKGSTTHIIDHVSTIKLEQGELLLLGPRISHRILPAGEEDVAVNIMVRPEFFNRTMGWMQTENVLRSFLIDVLRQKGDHSQVLHFRVADVPPVQNLVENLLWNTLSGEHSADDSLLSMTMGLLFTQLIKYVDRLETDELERPDSALTLSVLHYIEEHYRAANLSELAEQLHQPLYRLSRVIKKETGLTFKELLQQKRFQCAVQLLTETDLPVNAIIETVGYENTSYFHRKFRKQFALSPKEFRRRKINAENER